MVAYIHSCPKRFEKSVIAWYISSMIDRSVHCSEKHPPADFRSNRKCSGMGIGPRVFRCYPDNSLIRTVPTLLISPFRAQINPGFPIRLSGVVYQKKPLNVHHQNG